MGTARRTLALENVMPDPQDRVLDALTESTKAQQQQARRIDALERKFDTLEDTIKSRIGDLETEMSTMNAHLDNLVREAQTTNDLLRKEGDDRKAELERKQKIEDEERAHHHELEKDQRETYKKVAAELWTMFKQPLGFLIAAVVAWLVYWYFAVPHDVVSGSDNSPAAVVSGVEE